MVGCVGAEYGSRSIETKTVNPNLHSLNRREAQAS